MLLTLAQARNGSTVDEQHLIQDWYIMGGAKPVTQAYLEFTRPPAG